MQTLYDVFVATNRREGKAISLFRLGWGLFHTRHHACKRFRCSGLFVPKVNIPSAQGDPKIAYLSSGPTADHGLLGGAIQGRLKHDALFQNWSFLSNLTDSNFAVL